MSADQRSKAAFWDARILRWEKARYSRIARANPFSWTVRARMSLASRLLKDELTDSREILDLGCGSGILARTLFGDAERRYTGVDFSSTAISAARKRFERHADRIRFEVEDALSPRRAQADLAVFLGLLDWLSDEEARRLLAQRRETRLLFSFTETGGFLSSPYGLYRSRVDRTQRARSFRESYIRELLGRSGYRVETLHRKMRLGPACLVVAAKENLR